jgi:hypothetical protein
MSWNSFEETFMKRAAVLPFALLFGSAGSLAQMANEYHPQKLETDQAWTIILASPGQSHSCPVSLRAQQAAGGDMLAVDNARPKGIAQGIRIVVDDPNSRRIVAAKVTVRGLSAKRRMVQTELTDSLSSDAARTLDVKFPANAGKDTSAILWVPGLTAVQAIELNSLTYADGSIWKIAAGNVCRSPVDALMLVGNR